MEKQNNTKKYFIIYNCILAAVLVVLFSLMPMTFDDWGWGSAEGIERLKSFFSGYNGRYLGNLFVIVLTRYKILRIVIMTFFTELMIILASKLAAGKYNLTSCILTTFAVFITAFLGFLSPNANIFDQTVFWASGFANYVIVIPLILLYYSIFEKDYQSGDMNFKPVKLIMVFLLGFASCLFLENITFFCLAAGGLANLYFVIKYKKIHKRQVAYFVGTLIGAATMFTNSAYTSMLFKRTDETSFDSNFRSIGFLSIDDFYSFASRYNMPVKLLFAGLAVLLIVFIILAVVPLKLTKDKQERTKLYVILVGIAIMTAPMLFANGGAHAFIFTARVYFVQYILIIVYVLKLLSPVFRNRSLQKVVTVAGGAALVGIFAFLIVVYSGVRQAETLRTDYINEQVNNNSTTVEILCYPEKYDKYVYSSTAYVWNEDALNWVKAYYHIPEDKEVQAISYEDYIAAHNNE